MTRHGPAAVTGQDPLAFVAVGSRARATMLHRMAHHGPSTLSELADALGSSQRATLVHIRGLEARGIISRGRRCAEDTWDVNADHVDARHTSWLDYVLGL